MTKIDFDEPSKGNVSSDDTAALEINQSGSGGAITAICKKRIGILISAGEVFGEDGIGVYANALGPTAGAVGIHAHSDNGNGVEGSSGHRYGVFGLGHQAGVFGQSTAKGVGVVGSSDHWYGVLGESEKEDGLHGECKSGRGAGVFGESNDGAGVFGTSIQEGVVGLSTNSDGVVGNSLNGIGVHAYSFSSYGLYAETESDSQIAAFFAGNVRITGSLQKGGGSFKIDHPLDPANKYLSHSFVESPDMKNIYDGLVVLNDKGEAEIELPDWFGALNKDLRYQLTAIGSPGPNLYIAEEVSDETTNYSSNNNNKNKSNSHFKIAGGTSGLKVSWQVTGIRKDPWANAHRIQVEEDKPVKERGYFIYPDLYGQSAENGIIHLLFPEHKTKSALKWKDHT